MEYVKLSKCAFFSALRTKEITLDNYITTENMLPNKGGVCLVSELPSVNNASKYEKNDILLSNIRPYFKKIWLADKIGSCSNDVLVVKSKEGYLPKFLYYVLSDNNFFNYATVTSKGTKMPRGTPRAIMKYLVPDVTVEKQKKIAGILSTYDELIENNNKRIKILEQMAENLYKEWFVRFRFPGYETTEFENGLPKGWSLYQAQDLFNISIGRTPDRKQFSYFTKDNADSLWVSISDMKDSMFITNSSEYLTSEAIKKVNMPMVEAGTVLLSFKLSVGRVSITTKTCCTNEAIAHFKTNNKDILEYTYFYLKLFNYQDLGNTSAIGNAVNSTIIKKMKFILPTCEIIEKFHLFSMTLFDKIKSLDCENQNLIKQRDMLLPRLMSGKLEVN